MSDQLEFGGTRKDAAPSAPEPEEPVESDRVHFRPPDETVEGEGDVTIARWTLRDSGGVEVDFVREWG